jgi:DNA repair protein RecO
MERQPQPKLFQLLLTAMRALEVSDPELLGRVFETKLLAVLGYQPQFEGCVMGCDDGRQAPQPEATAGPVWFSIELGGALCSACAAHSPGALALSPPTVAAMAYFLRSPLDRAVRARIERRNRLELASFLHSFICYHGDVRPRSWQFAGVADAGGFRDGLKGKA